MRVKRFFFAGAVTPIWRMKLRRISSMKPTRTWPAVSRQKRRGERPI
jgi:hypothetical protein